jgi:hypothetical protein
LGVKQPRHPTSDCDREPAMTTIKTVDQLPAGWFPLEGARRPEMGLGWFNDRRAPRRTEPLPLHSGAALRPSRRILIARQPLHRHLPLRLILEIEIGDLLAVGVLHDEGVLTFLDRPWRREAARRGQLIRP